MKKTGLLFLIAFLFYLIGHFFWSASIVSQEALFINENIEIWIINVPFGLFAIFGLIASIRLYKYDELL